MTWQALGGATIVGACGLLTLWKTYRAVNTGMISLDVNFVIGLFVDNGNPADSDKGTIVFDREGMPKPYWLVTGAYACLTVILGLIAVVIARALQ